MLLPSKHFEHVIKLQSIEDKNKNSLSAKTPNKDIISAVDPTKLYAEPHGKFQSSTTSVKHRSNVSELSTLPEKIKKANQTDDLCTEIYAYIEAFNKKKKLTAHLNSCRINNSLLIKENCL